MAHHSTPPVAHLLSDDRLRIYFGPRDAEGRTTTAFIDVDPSDPTSVLHVHDHQALGLGALGAFDDSGAMPSYVIDGNSVKHLYYLGWNRGVTVPYTMAVGLAISTDGGVSFTRASEGPILDRSQADPYFTATACVLREDERWRMWYTSARGWLRVQGKPEPVYDIKYAESRDGVSWNRDNIVCIAARSEQEAVARPWVIREEGLYRMWYCCRGSVGYRTDPTESYRLGYAESDDGVSWTRKDDEVGFERSDTGWDSQMIAYPSLYEHEGRKYLLYNGNGFGESGIGYAVLEDD
jgi:hypothetical protein